jgi:hypothetical protein
MNTLKKTRVKDIRLTLKGRKYCSCLMKVRGKGTAPYGICYKSVLRGQRPPKGQGIACTVNYRFTDYTNKELREYAREKRINSKYVRGTKKGRLLSRKNLIQKLRRYQKEKLDTY